MKIKSYITLSISTCLSFSAFATQTIASCEQLLNIPHQTTEHYMLTQDVDCSGLVQDKAIDFQGSLDGQSHSISGLEIIYDHNYVGLFSRIVNGRISNLVLDNLKVPYNNGNTAVGLIAGQAIDSTSFYNVHIRNSAIQVQENISAGLGLLVGYATTKSVFTDVSINNSQIFTTDKSKHVGGLVGSMENVSLINAKINNNEIMVARYLGGRVTIGGAIGSMNQSTASHITSSNNQLIAPNMKRGYASKLIGSMNKSRLSDSTTHDYAEFSALNAHWNPAIVAGKIFEPFSETVSTLQNITTTLNQTDLPWFNSESEVLTQNLVNEE